MLHFATFPHMMVSVRVLTCSWKTNKIRLVFPYWLHIMLEKYFLFISSVGGFTYSCAGNWAARVDFLLFSHYWVKAKKTDNSSNNDKKACVKYTSCSYCRGQMSVNREVLLQASQVLGPWMEDWQSFHRKGRCSQSLYLYYFSLLFWGVAICFVWDSFTMFLVLGLVFLLPEPLKC